MTERTHVPRTTLSYIYTICVFLGHNMCFFWVRIDGIVGAVVAVPSSHGPRRTMLQVSTLCYNCFYFSVCGNVHTFNKNFVKHPVNTLKQKSHHFGVQKLGLLNPCQKKTKNLFKKQPPLRPGSTVFGHICLQLFWYKIWVIFW